MPGGQRRVPTNERVIGSGVPGVVPVGEVVTSPLAARHRPMDGDGLVGGGGRLREASALPRRKTVGGGGGKKKEDLFYALKEIPVQMGSCPRKSPLNHRV